MNVSVNGGGMQEEYFAASQTINKTKTKGRNKSYFHGVEKDDIRLTVNFAFENGWDEKELQRIRRWLTSPTYYAPLIFSNNPEKIYYALYIDEPVLLHNSLSEGYITIRFECNGSYAYTPLMMTPEFNWKDEDLLININNFSKGEFHGVELTGANKVQLNSVALKWSDILSARKTWGEIFN